MSICHVILNSTSPPAPLPSGGNETAWDTQTEQSTNPVHPNNGAATFRVS
ncbi:hypothetical protein BofuT4_uP071550.1 [Botrytis cinerea T4]|uniref:Uncharacterized protein n=1 Tax=Botryotinia fuckeliana (strain T4) TaxID=999810 RepID=G2XPX1_BOTF4|nr:hypothetical protein BofuT4_uP071550.1 [Botrytis cinerea T4]